MAKTHQELIDFKPWDNDKVRGELHRIKDDLSETWIEEYAEEGLKMIDGDPGEILGYRERYQGFGKFLMDRGEDGSSTVEVPRTVIFDTPRPLTENQEMPVAPYAGKVTDLSVPTEVPKAI